MASGFTPAAKHSQTINEGASVRKQGKELGIPWEDFCPAQISDWLLASILPNAASLMGRSTIKVGCKIKAESINLFLILGQESLLPSFHHGCAQPVRLHVEAREDIPCSRTSSRQHLATTPSLERKRLPSSLDSYWEGQERKAGLTWKG